MKILQKCYCIICAVFSLDNCHHLCFTVFLMLLIYLHGPANNCNFQITSYGKKAIVVYLQWLQLVVIKKKPFTRRKVAWRMMTEV